MEAYQLPHRNHPSQWGSKPTSLLVERIEGSRAGVGEEVSFLPGSELKEAIKVIGSLKKQ